MTTQQATFALRGRNPDVLTCIANLSNDEVFTPPEFATQMLDNVGAAWAARSNGEEIWSNPAVTFLDPFTKSGVFLREIASRLTKGLEDVIPDLEERVDHILTKQVFGMGITELTAMLARRSLYCSKRANGPHSIARSFDAEQGNVWFERTEHTWVGGTESVITADASGNRVERFTNGKCKYCGASQKGLSRDRDLESHAYAFIHADDINALAAELFGADMQFDVIIGNPPYQLDDGGYGSSAAPIYQKFVEQAKRLDPRFLSMVIPARWFAGGKGLDEFRATMLADDRVRALHDFPSTSEVFPGVNIRGGICYFLWDRDNRGDAEIRTYSNGAVVSSSVRPLLERGTDVFIRYHEGLSILKKVMQTENGANSERLGVSLPDGKRFSDLVSSRKPFGIATNFKGSRTPSPGDYEIFQHGGTAYVGKETVTAGKQFIDKYKLFVPYSSPGNDDYPHLVLSKPLVAGPGMVSTETYLLIGPFADERTALNAGSYMATRMFRFLIILSRSSQHITRRVYQFVPTQDFSQPWTDEKLFKKYGITEVEEVFIDRFVKPVAWAGDFG